MKRYPITGVMAVVVIMSTLVIFMFGAAHLRKETGAANQKRHELIVSLLKGESVSAADMAEYFHDGSVGVYYTTLIEMGKTPEQAKNIAMDIYLNTRVRYQPLPLASQKVHQNTTN